MNGQLNALSKQYASALQDYLNGAGETALQRAYELGREAATSGLGGMGLAKIHQEALDYFLRKTPSLEQTTQTLQLASSFFAESLSPLEMINRGFHDAIETLRLSEERYRTLIETARDVVYTLSKEGTFISINPAFETITGWLCSDWIGKSFVPLIHPDDLDFALNVFGRVMQGETPNAFELRVRCQSGEYRIGEFTTTPQLRNGEIIGALGIARDITERKRAQEQLRQNEEQFRLIAENIDDLIAVVDVNGKRIYNSPSYGKILGNPSSLRGTDSLNEIHPEDQDRIRSVFQRTVATGVGHRTEFRFIAKDGSVRYIESQGNVVKDKDGKTEKVIIVSRDITERKHADELIEKGAKQLAGAQQIAHLGSWEWDIVADKVTWSDELFRIYGTQPDEFKATYQAFLDRVHPDDRDKAHAMIEKSFATKEPFLFEHRIVLPDGTIRTLEARGEVEMDKQGRPIRMIGTGQDITERKRANEALRSLAKRVIDAQEEERYRIARELHDGVCQRLTGMRFVMEDLGDGIPTKDRGPRRRLKATLRQIDQLIVEVRRMSSNLRPASLDDFGLAIAMRRLCEEYQKLHNIKIQFKTNGSIPEHYETEIEIALYRILQEALSNIARHARTKRASVVVSQGDNLVTLDVEDNGKGFAEREGATRRAPGYGLGLLSMKERAEMLGGSFQIESRLKKGTKIHVEIPLQP